MLAKNVKQCKQYIFPRQVRNRREADIRSRTGKSLNWKEDMLQEIIWMAVDKAEVQVLHSRMKSRLLSLNVGARTNKHGSSCMCRLRASPGMKASDGWKKVHAKQYFSTAQPGIDQMMSYQ